MGRALAGSVALEDACRTAAAGRAHFEHRIAVTAASSAEAASELQAFALGVFAQLDEELADQRFHFLRVGFHGTILAGG